MNPGGGNRIRTAGPVGPWNHNVDGGAAPSPQYLPSDGEQLSAAVYFTAWIDWDLPYIPSCTAELTCFTCRTPRSRYDTKLPMAWHAYGAPSLFGSCFT